MDLQMALDKKSFAFFQRLVAVAFILATSSCSKMNFDQSPSNSVWNESNCLTCQENEKTIVFADFDWDGNRDLAILCHSMVDNKTEIAICTKNQRFLLDRVSPKLENWTISLQSAGKYSTACGKGYWECQGAEAPTTDPPGEVLNFYKPEGASFYFVWNEKNKGFDKVAISD